MNIDLKGKRAFVCGSTQGIGKAIAVELASMGAGITLLARDEGKLKQVVNELAGPSKHDYLVVDFSDPAGLKQKIKQYLEANGNINILINNTGGPPGGPITEAKIEEFTQAFSNHLLCNHILVQALLDGMKKSGYGRIVNIISTSVKQPLKNLGVSNTVRAAVANWSKTLANELAPFNITVNNVLPGATDTARIQNLIQIKSEKTGKSIADLKQEMIHEIPMGRLANASEVANAVAFLASPAASYITGINVPVDGGRTGSL